MIMPDVIRYTLCGMHNIPQLSTNDSLCKAKNNLDSVTLYCTKLRNPTQVASGNNDNSVRFRCKVQIEEVSEKVL
jgi:hypothetical protein